MTVGVRPGGGPGDGLQDWQAGGFGLYLHWPYCVSKCPYCDFNSHVATSVDHAAWARAYVSEIRRLAAETPDRRLKTIYFGGGTPSLMLPETVAEVITAALACWTPANDIEITLEANPGSVEVGRFRAFRAAGVNRVSLGVQALNDRDLQRLGRAHDVGAARRALDVARETFDRVSFDLIYARQDQSRGDWARELADALRLQPDHLSLYQLTIEDGTVFGRRLAAGQLHGLPGEDLSADMYLDTLEACELAGLMAYEVSNYARPGQESRHNLIYWQSGDYLGVGPGAHGRLTLDGTRHATTCPLAPAAWLDRINRLGSGETPREALTGEDRATEFLLMGLRIREGIDLARHARLGGQPLRQDRLDELIAMGLLQCCGTQLYATTRGRMVLNQVLARLLA